MSLDGDRVHYLIHPQVFKTLQLLGGPGRLPVQAPDGGALIDLEESTFPASTVVGCDAQKSRFQSRALSLIANVRGGCLCRLPLLGTLARRNPNSPQRRRSGVTLRNPDFSHMPGISGEEPLQTESRIVVDWGRGWGVPYSGGFPCPRRHEHDDLFP